MANDAMAAADLQAPTLMPLDIDCAALTAEQVAEVEARVRAELITTDARVTDAELACDLDQVTVTVRNDGRLARVPAPTSDGNLSDVLVQTFNEALQRLRLQELGALENEQVAVTPLPPAPIAGSTEATQPVVPALASSSSPSLPRSLPRSPSDREVRAHGQLEVSCGATLESWRGDAAFGPLCQASYGVSWLKVAWSLGALLPLQQASAFRTHELAAELGINWQPSWSSGLRLHAGAGGSLLSATPTGSYEPRGATQVGAGFLVLSLGRPVWLKEWALLPEAGVRLFAGKRRVNLDDDARLAIGIAAPRIGLGLLRRFD